MRRFAVPAVVALLLALAVAAQFALMRMRPSSAPAAAEGAFAALGGLRSIAAEVIWFRADRLQAEGRYVELAQLASALALMEPHTPEVWSYAAWNLAYNVSVMMPSDEDRWRWVYAGLKLLRDEGLALNPDDAELYRELAWLFELKLGTDIDSAAATYRTKWREIVEDVKSRGAWEELRLEPVKMLEIERLTKFDDWTDPRLCAIYFAVEGLRHADARNRAFLAEIIRQSQVLYSKAHGASLLPSP